MADERYCQHRTEGCCDDCLLTLLESSVRDAERIELLEQRVKAFHAAALLLADALMGAPITRAQMEQVTAMLPPLTSQ